MWRKRLRLAIAVFVVLFAAVVAVSLRTGRGRKAAAPRPARTDAQATIENRSGVDYQRSQQGKVVFSLKAGSQLTYQDGRTKLGGGVTLTLPDREGRSITVKSRDAILLNPPEHQLSHADFSGGVKLTTSDGITVTGAQSSYDDREGMVRVPGNVAFAKGRMTGTGVGATYDRNREVLWLLERARIDVAPDEKGGGAIHITSSAAGMARMEHYLKFTTNAHLEGEGRTMDANEATIFLSQDDKKVQRIELRGNSRITATGQNSNGAQAMSAQAIDLAYGEDGRTLQTAKLVDGAVVKLPGQSADPRQVAGRAIDISMGPDGSTVTSLVAQENVQVDLPAAGDVPARRIRSASLAASGAAGAGLQNASFTGGVDFREARAARGGTAAIDRTARSLRLDVQTKPGFGDLERADFHGNVHFTDGTDTTADAPLAVYAVAEDRLDLSPSTTGDPGPSPHVANKRITVDAVHIHMTLATQSVNADTKVKSVLRSEKRADTAKPAARGARGGAVQPVAPLPPAKPAESTRMPSILKQSEPVNVTANRLEYDGSASRATYTGSARLWQTDTVVQGDKIILDEKTGNLHALTNVVTVMTLTKPEDKPKPGAKPPDKNEKKPPTKPTQTTAQELVYDDAKHRATYTTKVHMNGPEGDVTGDTIELYLSETGGELERAEADGNVVSRQQDQQRRAYGDHLTYLAAKDEYTMVGKPVKVFDDKPPDCKLTVGTILTFHQAVDTISATGNGVTAGTKTETITCGAAGQPEWPR